MIETAFSAAVLVAVAPADDPLAVQADSASPAARPSAEKPAILVLRVKSCEFIIVSLPAQMHQA